MDNFILSFLINVIFKVVVSFGLLILVNTTLNMFFPQFMYNCFDNTDFSLNDLISAVIVLLFMCLCSYFR